MSGSSGFCIDPLRAQQITASTITTKAKTLRITIKVNSFSEGESVLIGSNEEIRMESDGENEDVGRNVREKGRKEEPARKKRATMKFAGFRSENKEIPD
jgi:hypothetical protein